MTLIYVIILAGLMSAIGQYVDKHLVNKGITRKDYFYYMCFSMIPYAIFMIIVEYMTGQLKFTTGIIPIILIMLAMFFRYKKQHTVVGCLTHLNPYEDTAYLTLGIVLAYGIDILIGAESASVLEIISIILIIIGVFIIADSKVKMKNLQKDILIRILTTLIIGYITYYSLQYMSNAIFLLIVNLGLTLIFSRGYKIKYHIENKNIIKWVFIQQLFGFIYLYASNYLNSNSVTLSSYVKPMSIICVVVISLFLKEKEKKPKVHQIIGVLIMIAGISLINV